MQALVRNGLSTATLVVGLLTGAVQAAPAASAPASALPEITVHGADLPPTTTPARVGKDGLQAVPALTAPVIDETGTLSATELAGLTDKLLQFERERGTQMAVLVVATTHPEDIAAYAHRVADQWKIGRREVGDGLLLVVAKNDRTVRIEVARALEGAVPDLAAYRIIDGVIVPAFRAGDFAGGLTQAVEHLQARVRGENLPLPEARTSTQNERVDINMLVVFGLFIVPFVSGVLRALLGKTLGTLATGGVGGALVWLVTGSLLLGLVGVVLAMMLGVAFSSGRGMRGGWPGGGWGGGGGGWSGGGGGGGWSSGGGGSFGGGGASGRW
ncbi:TPM domain-containing protein [uncultured Aquabacterium sp.]|jgi:uncharacterized protein|uniref:TPM domain-containing protein n=1 Tax=uncultured Aquabacterium sp. TaxID=158753 RepID=UPI00261BDDB2|nr:TPM domain-containing protein [uncultured Aquabacterium sp.]